jgi:hypothetical protein
MRKLGIKLASTTVVYSIRDLPKSEIYRYWDVGKRCLVYLKLGVDEGRASYLWGTKGLRSSLEVSDCSLLYTLELKQNLEDSKHSLLNSKKVQPITTMSLPTIIFVHGAWHYPEFFDATRAILKSNGYKTHAISMPAVFQKPAVTSLDEDIAAVRGAVLHELDAGNDVIIHAHSTSARTHLLACAQDIFHGAYH